MFENYPLLNYSSPTLANPNVLYASLGTFWTTLFSEKGTIKGYTIGQAEELTQRYLDLIEIINSYSSEDIPIFHREKWYPVRIKKSQFQKERIYFEPATSSTQLIFGAPSGLANSDSTYAFGDYRDVFEGLYVAAKENPALKNFAILSNRIIAPTTLYVKDVDVRLQDTRLVFNSNIFEDPNNIAYNSYSTETGEWEYYIDENGDRQIDQELILWAYQADLDEGVGDSAINMLQQNFGYLFNVSVDSTKFFKDLLNGLVKFYSSGPSIQAVQMMTAALVGVEAVKSAEEIIEDHYRMPEDDQLVVVTNLNVYRYDGYYDLMPVVRIGAKVYAGDVLVNAVQYHDYVRSKRWWNYGLYPNVAYDTQNSLKETYDASAFQMTLPAYLFLGNYRYGLTFKNEFELATKIWSSATAYTLTFPVYGSLEDVEIFHAYINDTSEANKNDAGLTRQEQVAQALGLVNDEGNYDTKVTGIYPLDFVFDNFLKSNSALVRLNFKSLAEIKNSMNFLSLLREVLPSYVYFMFHVDVEFPEEELQSLYGSTDVWAWTSSWKGFSTDDVLVATDTFHIHTHGFETGDYVIVAGNDLPKGVKPNRVYTVAVTDENNFKLEDRDSGLPISLGSTGYASAASSFVVKVVNYGANAVLMDNADGSSSTGFVPADQDTTHSYRGCLLKLLCMGRGLDLFTVDDDNTYVVPAPTNASITKTNTRDWVGCNGIGTEQAVQHAWTLAGEILPGRGTSKPLCTHNSRILFFDYSI